MDEHALEVTDTREPDDVAELVSALRTGTTERATAATGSSLCPSGTKS